ncbi:MerR family transcriptional regulator [Streptomyces sp. NPDC094447]|uniref:MerR family transcriptional regulator n=1 Tax=Streptomyces sp. NPDC094447 TaxID=3366062 RepID=UPI0037F3385B
MVSEGLWSIGELARRAGVGVKTVRYYSDRGLLPEAERSSGGHRRYGAGALDRLLLIRSLRGLGLPVPEVERVLAAGGDPDGALEEAVSGQLREVESRLVALRWREASLRLLADGPPGERAERLRLVGPLPAPPDTEALARFWRRSLPVRLPARVVSTVLDSVVPALPAEPSPRQVLDFARLHALVADPRVERPAPPLPDGEYRPAVLYEGLAEAYALASAELAAGRAPHGGGALDCFVDAYARARGTADSAAFRRGLPPLLARGEGPVMTRYWKLAAGLFAPGEPVLGALHHHLSVALRVEVGSGGGTGAGTGTG